MGKISVQSLFQICLVIAGQSPTNVTMNLYFMQKRLSERLEELQMNRDLTVDEIMSVPQMSSNKVENPMDDEEVEVAIINNKAYWIKNNSLYTSKINEFGEIDIKNAAPLDVFSLSNKEMQMLMKIVDSLN